MTVVPLAARRLLWDSLLAVSPTLEPESATLGGGGGLIWLILVGFELSFVEPSPTISRT